LRRWSPVLHKPVEDAVDTRIVDRLRVAISEAADPVACWTHQLEEAALRVVSK